MIKGFITIPILFLVVLGISVIGAGAYGVVKLNELQNVNRQLLEKIADSNEESVLETLSVGSEVIEEDFSSSTNSQEDESATSTLSQEVEKKQDIVENVVKEKVIYVPVNNQTESLPTPVVKEVEKLPEVIPESKPELGYLKISDVDIKVDGSVVDVYWKTNKNSDSRLIIKDNETVVSDKQDDTKHHVKIYTLEFSSYYSFEIVSEVDGEKDSYFGNFATERIFTVNVVDAKEVDNECLFVFVIDSQKKPLINTSIRISGTVTNSDKSQRFLAKTLDEKTDINGKVKYCSPIDDMVVENVKTNEEYFRGPV